MAARPPCALCARPGSAVCRLVGHLLAPGAEPPEGEVSLTQEECLDRGLAALFDLIA
jgi:hypothetical protein